MLATLTNLLNPDCRNFAAPGPVARGGLADRGLEHVPNYVPAVGAPSTCLGSVAAKLLRSKSQNKREVA